MPQVDPPGDTTVPITQLKRSSIQDFIGPQSTKMPTTLSPDVTFVNVKAKFRNVMRCHKTLSKFVKSLTCGALTICWPFPSFKRAIYILVAVDYLSKWVEAKALPTNDARVVCKFLKTLFSRFGAPLAIIKALSMLSQNSGQISKVSGHRSENHYFGGDIPTEDFPDCEDSRARSIHMSFTSSASFWESSIQI
ncbi:reverse transcriptase domain-containing protein [Tanacetum coccineum]